jgi:secondary thiamine-phosphate synthase enzyme
MKQHFQAIQIATTGPGLYVFTDRAVGSLAESTLRDGLLTCFVRHTSASLLIQENADRDVLSDLEAFMRRLVSRDPKFYRHTTEGADDMPSHIRSALTAVSISIPFRAGRLVLGTWQGLFLFEHRDAPHAREILLHAIGD